VRHGQHVTFLDAFRQHPLGDRCDRTTIYFDRCRTILDQVHDPDVFGTFAHYSISGSLAARMTHYNPIGTWHVVCAYDSISAARLAPAIANITYAK
jgi:hypothetical protein